MSQSVILHPSKLLKRLLQVSYLISHPVGHGRCIAALWGSKMNRALHSSTKYLGKHIALSLRTAERRDALIQHHQIATKVLMPGAAREIRDGAVLWRREVGDHPPLMLVLRPSKLAPMEGELELNFAYRSELYVLTFLFGPGRLFGLSSARVLFIGGLQGRFGAQMEIREASKLNLEIAPATMLLIAVRAIARSVGAEQLLAIGETDQISMSYSAPLVRFDYATYWRELGGHSVGKFYSIPIEPPSKPLSLLSRSHRSRARRRREEKQRIREQIERRVQALISA